MYRMMHRLTWLLLATSVVAGGDVTYVQEVVNSGVGSQKRGARRTVHEIQIKGVRQRVSTDIEAPKDVARTLQKQGVILQGTKILLLDQGRLYDIDREASTYRQQTLPAPTPKPAPATPGAAPGGAAKPAAPVEPKDREITVRTKVLADTTSIAGILCHRVAAEMTARHFKPGTTTVERINRFLYQAWMADGFPAYAELLAFRRRQEQQTSLAPLVGGGLDQLADAVEDPERLATELAALQGFPMQSELKVFVTVGKAKERELLSLSSRVLRLSQDSLPESLFQPSRELKPVP